MPNIGELIGELVALIGEVLGASSLRLGVGPTLAVLGVLLVLLHLVARPISRWTVRDLGALSSVPRAMAIAAEAGSRVRYSLGTAGIARSTAAGRRLQTLASLPLLDHVARTAGRAGVPLHVTTNDPVAALAAESALDVAHDQTATSERRGRATVEYLGEGRVVPAGRALADEEPATAAFVLGSLGEEAILLLEGLAAGTASATAGTADAGQATSVLLEGDAVLVGPELYLAPGDVRTGDERTVTLASNRLLLIALAVLVLGTLLALTGIGDPSGWLLGAG